MNIPVEFLSGLWITLPEGLQGQGSGFLLAEDIQYVFAVGVDLPRHENYSVVSITEKESDDHNYLSAFVRLITESWTTDMESVLLLACDQPTLERVLQRFMLQIGKVKNEIGAKIVRTKIKK